MPELAYAPDPRATRDAFPSRHFRCCGGFPNELLSALIHYWPLGEASGTSRADSIGSNNLNETGGVVASAAGKNGNAADFRNVPTHYLTSGTESLAVPFTLVLWANPESLSGFTDLMLKQAGDDSGPQIYTNGGDIVFGNSNDGPLVTIPLGAIGAWHLLVLVLDGAGNYKASVDNGLFVTAASTTVSTDSVYRVGFASIAGAFDGLIDEVMVFNTALTQENVAALWNNGNGRFL